MRNQKVVVFIASLEEKDSPEAIHPVPRGFLSLGEIEDSRLKLQAKNNGPTSGAERWNPRDVQVKSNTGNKLNLESHFIVVILRFL
ncbi:hypothetical protein ACJQWK_06313 [Exserohilum turcicum]